MDKRALGVEYFIKSLSTGERTAAQRLEPLLAEDAEFDTNTQPGIVPIGRQVLKGRSDVLNQVFGLWPATPGYSRMGWSDPEPTEGGLRVTTSGAVTVDFSFNDRDEIQRVVLEGGYGSGISATPQKGGPVETIPLAAKGVLNNALANQTPIVVTYVDQQGAPHSSLRGSVCVFSPTEIAIWVRHADGGLPTEIAHNDQVSLLYNDRKAGATIIVQGRARIATDEESRRKAFELSPEVEQTHDPDMHGVPLIIDVMKMQANLGAGRSYSLSR